MSDRAAFAYAQARLQAHHGRRPTPAAWQVLGASKSLGHYLESARPTGLGPWITHLGVTADVHTIEDALRREWRAFVARVASWLPREWRRAALWVGMMADLPLSVHVARGHDLPAWAGQADVSARAQQWPGERDPLKAWCERFCALWPHMARGDAQAMESLIGALGGHLAAEEGEAARERLRTHLGRVFRSASQRPAAVFAFLALAALDVEKLRGDLAGRSLFPELAEG